MAALSHRLRFHLREKIVAINIGFSCEILLIHRSLLARRHPAVPAKDRILPEAIASTTEVFTVGRPKPASHNVLISTTNDSVTSRARKSSA